MELMEIICDCDMCCEMRELSRQILLYMDLIYRNSGLTGVTRFPVPPLNPAHVPPSKGTGFDHTGLYYRPDTVQVYATDDTGFTYLQLSLSDTPENRLQALNLRLQLLIDQGFTLKAPLMFFDKTTGEPL